MPIHLSKWSQHDWTRERIDRFFSRQNFRLVAGLHLSYNAAQLNGALSVVQGRGKFLRVKHVEHIVCELEPSIQAACLETLFTEEPDLHRLKSLGNDLVDPQTAAIEQLLRTAGKYVDRVLCVALDNRGIWHRDFDGKQIFSTIYRAQSLAERTGANIVDGIRERDLAAGGNGEFLDALPAWLAYGNRSSQNPDVSTVLISCEDNLHVYFLPATDGLDETIPEIRGWRFSETMALDVIQCVERVVGEAQAEPDICIVGSNASIAECLRSRFQKGKLSTTEIAMDTIASAANGAVLASLMGAMFVDQMPGNVPTLTGAASQRILGRVTPGKPMAWRNLLINMNDGDSPIMKLRDAV